MNEKTGLEHYEKLYGDLNLPPDDAAKWIFLSGWNSAMGEAMRRVNSMPFGNDTRASFAVYFQQMMVLDPEAVKEKPAPVQEPVGVFVEDDDIGHVRLIPHQQLKLKDGDKLYTTPPAQPAVPLTDEQKRDLIKKSALWDMHIHIGWYSAPAKSFVEKTIQLIADIEAAHGITEKGQP